MVEVRLSPVAQADFDAIIDHLSSVAGNKAAAKYAARLQATANRLADFPGIGAPRPQLGTETRLVVLKPYLIFYDGGPQSETVHVLRILHGSRNITPALVARGRHP
jgi:plasmid stabilization system protein ParE